MSAQVKLKYLDSTMRNEKKRNVESMISRLLARWVIPGMIAEMLPEQTGLQRLQNHPLITHSQVSHEHLSLAGVHGCAFAFNGKKVRDDTAGWMGAKWMKEFCGRAIQ